MVTEANSGHVVMVTERVGAQGAIMKSHIAWGNACSHRDESERRMN